MNKKRLLMFVLAVVMCLALICVVACNPETPDTPDNPDNPDKPNPDTPTPVDPDAQSIAIANESDLIKKWNVGEADRTVSVTLSDGLKDKTVTLKAEPEGIVTVDGLKLHAVKKGTVQVTASVTLDETHTYTTDPIEITVAYNYTLAVSNKAALTKAFRIGEADREVTVTVPDALKDLDVKLTSADTTKVSIVNGKLHAVAAAHDGVKITASVQLADGTVFSDSFTVKTWGAFDLNVTNKEALEAVYAKLDTEGRTVEYTLTEAGDYTEADVAITSENANVVRIENGKIMPVGVGKTTVKVACGGVTKTLAIKVEAKPVLTLVFDENAVRYVGEKFDLPTVTALNSKEEPVTVTPVCANSHLGFSDQNTKATADQFGRYTLTYTLHEEGQDDVVDSVDIDVVDKLFSATGAHRGNDTENQPLDDAKITTKLVGEGSNLKQVTTSDRNVLVFGKLNVNPSQLYYAEVTFATDITYESRGDIVVGLGHFLPGTDSLGRFGKVSMIDYKDYNFRSRDVVFNKSNDISIPGSSARSPEKEIMFSYKVFTTRHIEQNTSTVKVAILRDGAYLYSFVNDSYVWCIATQDFANQDTVPAIVGKYLSKDVAMTNISYSADEATVEAKMTELLGANKEKMIVHYSGQNDADSSTSYADAFNGNAIVPDTTKNSLDFTYTNQRVTPNADGPDTVEANYNNFNGSVISPYIFFEGNFTFQWDYQYISEGNGTSGSNGYKVMTELRSHAYTESIQMGSQYGDVSKSKKTTYADNAAKFFLNVYDPVAKKGDNNYINSPTFNKTDTLRFKLTRIVKDDCAYFVLSATVLDATGNATGTIFTRVYTSKIQYYQSPSMIVWHNPFISGKYSNVKWESLADNCIIEMPETAESTVTATKNDTAPEWQFTINDLTKDIIVDLGEGNTITKGKYVVTLSAMGLAKASTAAPTEQRVLYSDLLIVTEETKSMRYLALKDVNLSYGIYKVTLTQVPPVTVTNEKDFENWKLGDADKTLNVALDNVIATNVTSVTSSDTNVVSVGADGRTLTAVAVGKATITVTPNAGTPVSFEVTVHHGGTVTIANADALTAEMHVGDEDRTVEITEAVTGVLAEGTVKTVAVTSSNEAAVTVVGDATAGYSVHAVAVGESTITVTCTVTTNGVTDTVTVTVKVTVREVTTPEPPVES